jgi:nucleoside-diphosphate-sugar epimerase
MRILITGNMGYVGSVLVRHLRERRHADELIGFDAGYFAHCLTAATSLPETVLDTQYFGDVRSLPERLLAGVDAVVHLAAVSNDPMGNRFEVATDEINHRASVRLARLAQAAGVRSFVFASSCSIYGRAEGARREGDALTPLTAYARSKVATETALREGDWGAMTVTSLRFATACGASDRLRLDLVLNDFVACAIAAGEITVLSDGTPWRPLIDVADMARAIDWAIGREGDRYLAVNTGSDAWNYQVSELAHAVADAIPGTRVAISTDAPPDARSYRVDFSLFRSIAPAHQPQATLTSSIDQIRRLLQSTGFADREFRSSSLMRLRMLETHIAAGRLRPDLRWRGRDAVPDSMDG